MSVTYGLQSLGARSNQEDAFRIVQPDARGTDPDLLLLLADGMGGHVGGEIAAELVLDEFELHCTAVSQAPRPRQRMTDAMEAANEALRCRVAEEPALAGMGATLLGAIKRGDRLSWLSVGDSPLYLWRDGSLRRLNEDHSVHGELLKLVADGRMSRAEADRHPGRNALRSALTGGKVALVDANAIELFPGDVVLLASDGLQTVPDARIAAVLEAGAGKAVQQIAEDLLDAVAAEEQPRQDNTTVVLLRYAPDAAPQDAASEPVARPADRPFTASARRPAAVLLAGLVLGVMAAAAAWTWYRAQSADIAAPTGHSGTGATVSHPVGNAPVATPPKTPPHAAATEDAAAPDGAGRTGAKPAKPEPTPSPSSARETRPKSPLSSETTEPSGTGAEAAPPSPEKGKSP